MQRTKLLTLSAAALLSAAPSKLTAQTWETVLDYQFIQGGSSGANCITADGLGNVFAGGVGYPATTGPGIYGSGLVLKTDTTETAWFLSDDSDPSAPQYGSEVNSLGYDFSGSLYSAGTFYSPCTKAACPGSSWYVRQSSDSGVSWSTVDSFQYAAGKNAGATSVAGDGSGNVFVVGNAYDASLVQHWVVRRSAEGGTWATVDNLSSAKAYSVGFVPNVGLFTVGQLATAITSKGKTTTTVNWLVRRSLDGGTTWTTVDLLQPPTGYGAWWAARVSSDNQGNVYVAGKTTILVGSTAVSQWLVRESTDGGTTWATVDAFSYVKGGYACGIGRDSVGNVVVTGDGIDSSGGAHWLVRRPNAQGSWQNVDDHQLAPGATAQACGVAADAAGNLLVTGAANDASGISHWIVRRF